VVASPSHELKIRGLIPAVERKKKKNISKFVILYLLIFDGITS
jgi:hypothetical protein